MGHSQQQQQQRHLKELLQEDQEPFKLSSYIADKRSKLSNHLWKRPHRQKHHHHQPLHLQKQPPNKLSTVSRKAPFPSNFCTNSTCFPFSYSSSSSPFGSPDNFRKSSPVLSSPHNKSTINIKGASSASSPHEFSLRVPAKTATLLLEAALRIQNSSSSSNNNSKVQVKNSGLGLLGSVIRRVTLTHHRRAHKHLTRTGESPTRDGVVKWVDDEGCGGRRKSNKSSRREYVSAAETRGEYHDMGFGGKSNYELEDQTRGSDGKLGRFWSEEIIKSEESSGSSSFSTSSSCYTTSSYSNGDCCSNIIREESDEEVACVSSLARHNNCIIGGGGSAADDFTFCLSPNVRFGHYNNSSCSSPGRCPNSPASPYSPAKSSPSRFNFEERVNFEQQNSSVEPLQGKVEGYHDQEDKEHNSPVCVLDLVFGDEEEKDDDDDEAFSLNSCSYKLVQRARQHLLRKLQNFEELAAELEEPIKKLDYEEEEEGDDSSSSAVCINDKCNSQEDDILKPVAGMKRLITDLICEEEEQQTADSDDYEVVIRRVWKRLESWDEIAPSTIEMMVGVELINGGVQKNWKYDGQEEIAGAATEVELLILSVLVEEVVNDVLLN